MYLTRIICDVCEEDCGSEGNGGYAIIKADWGYDSNYDGQEHQMVVCPDCYEKLIGKYRDKVWIISDSLADWNNTVPRQGLDDLYE